MKEAHPQPETTEPHRRALDALASAYAQRLEGVMAAPEAGGTRTPFSAIPPDLFQAAFDAWKGTHPDAARSSEHARRGVYRVNPREPRDLRAVADVLEGGGAFLAAAAVHAERAKLHHDTVSVETRAQRAEVERTVAGLLERADRPADALQVYEIARRGLEADPRHAASARSCRDSIARLRARAHAAGRVAKAQWFVQAANALTAEKERLGREAVDFFRSGEGVDGVRRLDFQSTDALFDDLGRHLRSIGSVQAEPIAEPITQETARVIAQAEIIAEEIDKRMRGREPELLALLTKATLAELREQRGAALTAEPLRESVYLTSAHTYGHGDPRTIEAARDYVENLRSEHNLATPETYARAAEIAQQAMRKATLARMGETLRYLASGRRTAPPVPKKFFKAAMGSLESSAMEAGQDARRTADQLPPRLYTNSQRGLRGAMGKIGNGGVQRGEATRRKAVSGAPRARRSGR